MEQVPCINKTPNLNQFKTMLYDKNILEALMNEINALVLQLLFVMKLSIFYLYLELLICI